MARKASRPIAGVCSFCGCSEWDPCPEGCAWANRAQTICSECTAAAKAEQQSLKAFEYRKHASQLAIFHRGFLVGWFGLRGKAAANPYAQSFAVYVWNRGRDQGKDAARVHRNTFGPITNAPRARHGDRQLEAAMIGGARC